MPLYHLIWQVQLAQEALVTDHYLLEEGVNAGLSQI
jgi:hypothetical protein